MYNKVILVGHLTRDIELKFLQSGQALAKAAIATSYKYKSATGEQKEDVCFLDFNIFGRKGEVANQYLRKGSKVLLEGRLVFEQWTAQDGSTRSRHSLNVDEMKLLDPKENASPYAAANAAIAAAPSGEAEAAPVVAPVVAPAAVVAPANVAPAIDLNDPAVLAAIAAMTQQNAAPTVTAAPTTVYPAPAAKPAVKTPVIEIDEDEIPF